MTNVWLSTIAQAKYPAFDSHDAFGWYNQLTISREDKMAKTRQEAIAELTAPGETYELYEGSVLGRKCLKFKNAPPTLRDLFLEAKSKIEFLVYEDTRLTFEEAYIEASKIALFGLNPIKNAVRATM